MNEPVDPAELQVYRYTSLPVDMDEDLTEASAAATWEQHARSAGLRPVGEPDVQLKWGKRGQHAEQWYEVNGYVVPETRLVTITRCTVVPDDGQGVAAHQAAALRSWAKHVASLGREPHEEPIVTWVLGHGAPPAWEVAGETRIQASLPEQLAEARAEVERLRAELADARRCAYVAIKCPSCET